MFYGWCVEPPPFTYCTSDYITLTVSTEKKCHRFYFEYRTCLWSLVYFVVLLTVFGYILGYGSYISSAPMSNASKVEDFFSLSWRHALTMVKRSHYSHPHNVLIAGLYLLYATTYTPSMPRHQSTLIVLYVSDESC